MEQELETLTYRLTNIETKLNSLEKLLTHDALQERDISELKKNFEKFLMLYDSQSKKIERLLIQQEDINELTEAINAHDKRIKALELAPIQSKAEKWNTIIDCIFKAIVAITCTLMLSKIGLSVT